MADDPACRLRGQPEDAQARRRDVWLGEDRGRTAQDSIYWTGQSEGANRLLPGYLQPDANGDDLWLAIEHGVGRNPPTGCRKAATTPICGQKTG
jgi:hypothetical protein